MINVGFAFFIGTVLGVFVGALVPDRWSRHVPAALIGIVVLGTYVALDLVIQRSMP